MQFVSKLRMKEYNLALYRATSGTVGMVLETQAETMAKTIRNIAIRIAIRTAIRENRRSEGRRGAW